MEYVCTICPRSGDPFKIVTILYQMGHYFLDIQYICTRQGATHIQMGRGVKKEHKLKMLDRENIFSDKNESAVLVNGVVVYHVIIIAIRHGSLNTFGSIVIGCVLCTAGSFLYLKLCRPAYFLSFNAIMIISCI